MTIKSKHGPLALAHRYMEIVFDTGNLDELFDILAADCTFSGPFVQCSTAAEYVAAMKDAPPERFNYALLHQYENGQSACLVYEFFKPGVKTSMAQVFEIGEHRIEAIRLIFDSRAFG